MGIKTFFRELKHVNGASNFHSKKREYIEMEVWARLLPHNFCSGITGYVAINRRDRKHPLQVNYSAAYKACRHFLRLHSRELPPDIEGLIEKNTLPIRSGRKYARQHRFRSALYIALHKADQHNIDSVTYFEADCDLSVSYT